MKEKKLLICEVWRNIWVRKRIVMVFWFRVREGVYKIMFIYNSWKNNIIMILR